MQALFANQQLPSPDADDGIVRLNIGGHHAEIAWSAGLEGELSPRLAYLLSKRWGALMLRDPDHRIFLDMDMAWLEPVLDALWYADRGNWQPYWRCSHSDMTPAIEYLRCNELDFVPITRLADARHHGVPFLHGDLVIKQWPELSAGINLLQTILNNTMCDSLWDDVDKCLSEIWTIHDRCSCELRRSIATMKFLFEHTAKSLGLPVVSANNKAESDHNWHFARLQALVPEVQAQNDLMKTRSPQSVLVSFNINGQQTVNRHHIVAALPGSQLAARFSGKWFEQAQDLDKKGCIRVDQPRIAYISVLNYVRYPAMAGSKAKVSLLVVKLFDTYCFYLRQLVAPKATESQLRELLDYLIIANVPIALV